MSFPKLPKPPRSPRILRLRTPVKIPTGPTLFRPEDPRDYSEWTNPPKGFVGATNSTYEWMIYLALAKIFDNPENPRVGPFVGGPPQWTYQKVFEGGRKRPGGAVIDFLVYDHGRGGKPIALRVVTEAFHLFTSSRQQAIDAMQRSNVEKYANVIDLLDYKFIHDPTGQAAVILVKRALNMIESPNPLLAGTAIRGSRLKQR